MIINSLAGPKSPNQFQDISFLGRGGMGEVYLANDSVYDQKVAVKLIRAADYTDTEQLESEFNIAKSLIHSNIVRTYYTNRATIDGDNYFYAVMEYINGTNLREYMEHLEGPFPLIDVLAIMLQLTDGLAVAHEKIVHRDLKPENILISANQIVKICDFGISKLVLESTRNHTFKGWGTKEYMAPEGVFNEVCHFFRPSSTA